MQRPTPQPRRYEIVAQISKTKGLDGQLVALERGGLSVLRPELEVWVVPPALEGVRHTTLTEVQESKHKSGVLIKLAGVDDRPEAEELVGRHLLARTEDLGQDIQDPSGRGFNRAGDLVNDNEAHSQDATDAGVGQQGLAFSDTTYGPLGTLVEKKAGPAYDIWVIEGPHGILEIPAVEAYIAEEDESEVTLTLPAGFIEITSRNKGGDNRDAD